MSLIPSESYSFPDHFTSTKAASRNPKKVEPQQMKKPAIVALPNPTPQVAPQTPLGPQPQQAPAPVVAKQNPQPMRKIAPPVPNPAMRRASAPPPRVPETPPVRKIPLPPTLKPKVRWNQRAPAMDPTPVPQNGAEQFPQPPMPTAPAQNVILMKPVKPASEPRVIARPAPEIIQKQTPAPPTPAKSPARMPPPMQSSPIPQPSRASAASSPQEDFFQMFAESGETVVIRRRRKAKLRRFLICETLALAVLLPLAVIGLADRPSNAALLWIMNIFTIASAVAAAVIPILFYAFTPTLPEIER